jgi:CheY-like chemotaxis protein
MMPGMDGVEAACKIRGLDSEYAKKVPIIALTANAMLGDIKMFFANGFDDYLSKPVEIRKLNVILEKWIPREKQIQTGAVKAGSSPKARNVPEIPGLDIVKGLHNTGGTLKGYRLILSIYCRDAQINRKKIQETLLSRDFSLYTTLVHAIKGASLTIGAVKLGELAAELEAAGRKENLAVMEEKTGALIAALETLLEHITRALDANVFETEEPGAVPDFDSLKAALATDDYMAVSRELERLNNLPLDKKTRELLDTIENDVLLYEFDRAVVKLTAFQ